MSQENEVVHVPQQDVEFIDATEHILQMATRRDGLIQKVKDLAIKATNSGDWVDQNGTPYMMASAAEKIRSRFALRVWDVSWEKHLEKDDKGEYYYFVYSGKVGFSDVEFIEAVGTCSSRDQFFAKRAGVLLPTSEVDITNIQKAAYTNLMANGITRFLGLRNLTWEELAKLGILKAEIKNKVQYQEGKKAAQWSGEQGQKAHRIGNWLLAEADGDKAAAGAALERLTCFTDATGKPVAGKKELKHLSGKQIDILWKKVEKEVVEFEKPSGGEEN